MLERFYLKLNTNSFGHKREEYFMRIMLDHVLFNNPVNFGLKPDSQNLATSGNDLLCGLLHD